MSAKIETRTAHEPSTSRPRASRPTMSAATNQLADRKGMRGHTTRNISPAASPAASSRRTDIRRALAPTPHHAHAHRNAIDNPTTMSGAVELVTIPSPFGREQHPRWRCVPTDTTASPRDDVHSSGRNGLRRRRHQPRRRHADRAASTTMRPTRRSLPPTRARARAR